MQNQGIPEAQNSASDTLESLKAQLAEAQKAKELAEQRMKDTQGAYTKSRQQSKALEAKLNTLQEHLSSIQSSVALPEDIERLKTLDPDKWYEAKRQLEVKTQQDLHSKLSEAEKIAMEAEIKALNTQLLTEFKLKNPEISDDYIENEIPYRIKAKLDRGEVSFADFLNEVEAYHKKGKVVSGAGTSIKEQPDLSKMGSGEGVMDKYADAEAFVASYSKSVI